MRRRADGGRGNPRVPSSVGSTRPSWAGTDERAADADWAGGARQTASAPQADRSDPAERAELTTEERTRDRVAHTLLLERAVTASAISAELGLTPAAVRRHLDALVADGLAEPGETPPTGQRGRPARSYRLTDAGRERFPQNYENLAVAAVRFLGDTAGEEAVSAFARSLAARIEQRVTDSQRTAGSHGRSDDDLVRALADALDADGYATSVRPVGLGAQLCQHHCPVAHVATAFPQLCEAETEVFSRVLGKHVQRLATIAHGDGVCTTHIPGPTPAPPGTTVRADERPSPSSKPRRRTDAAAPARSRHSDPGAEGVRGRQEGKRR